MKLKRFASQSGDTVGYHFWCPACGYPHPYHVKGRVAWGFNGDMERPTFTPSLLVHGTDSPDPEARKRFPRCHLFLTDGVLQFCGDSAHAMAGKSVPLPDWPYEESDT